MTSKDQINPQEKEWIPPHQTKLVEIFSDQRLSMQDRMAAFVRHIQLEIVHELQQVDGNEFRVDQWSRPNNGGGGISMCLQEGSVFEKAGVNFSQVRGRLGHSEALRAMKHRKQIPTSSVAGSEEVEREFYATGVSMVLHPWNPMCPTVHLNYRYFEILPSFNGAQDGCWWFGGGCDLTPAYLFEEDAVHFHSTLKHACDTINPSANYYQCFKEWCDKYFFIEHRQEMRGIGGIFFDDFDELPQEECFRLVQSCARSFLPSYVPIIQKRKALPFTDEEKQWQQLRRGRYVEFNLIYDRGTKFGLATPGSRIESILVSLPLTARWEYCAEEPKADSREYQLLQAIRNPRQWVP